MKRLTNSVVALIAALTLVSTAACSGNSAGEGAGEFVDTATYTPRSDTISDLYGRLTGYRITNELRYYIESTGDSTYSYDEFLRGVETVVGQRRPMENISGIMLGLRMEAGDLRQLDTRTVKISREKVLAAMRVAMATDSVSPIDQQRSYSAFQKAMNSFAADSTSISTADSLATAYGNMVGLGVATEIAAQTDNKKPDIQNFIKGVEILVGKSNSDEFIAGVSSGLSMAQDIASVEHDGVNVRRNVVMDSFKKAYRSDAIPEAELEKIAQQYQDLVIAINNEYREREDKRLAATDEAVKNIKTGEALVAKMKKANPAARTTESGLTYIITNAGTGDRIKDDDTVIVKYTGSHLDGKVFDSSENAKFLPKLTVKGFAEGLRMLGKGGKATFWIPGKLGYGGRGVPQAGIEPMETLVFDVEIIDIEKAKKPTPEE